MTPIELFHQAHAVTLVHIAPTDLDVPDIQADYSAPFIQTFQRIVGWVLAVGTLLAFAGLVVCGVILVFGGLDSSGRTRMWKALGMCALGVMFMGSITGAMAFFGGMTLF